MKSHHVGKNTHMMHIEDLILYQGLDGYYRSLKHLNTMAAKLVNLDRSGISVKWDGAPAIFAGTDPQDGRFFVSTKRIFNIDPQVFKHPDHIDNVLKGGLNRKMHIAFQNMSKLNIQGVLQGDMMFTASDLKTIQPYRGTLLVIHPNTIAYAVDVDSKVGQAISAAQMGVVWHTSYSGDHFTSMEANYAPNLSTLTPTTDVWSHSAQICEIGYLLEHQDINQLLCVVKAVSQAGSNVSANQPLFNHLCNRPNLCEKIEIYFNLQIRNNIKPNTDHYAEAVRLLSWLQLQRDQHLSQITMRHAIIKAQDKYDDQLGFFNGDGLSMLADVLSIRFLITAAKQSCINTLNKMRSDFTPMIHTQQYGYAKTTHEGYVQHIGNDVVKFIDRKVFSHNNFSPYVRKGWDSRDSTDGQTANISRLSNG